MSIGCEADCEVRRKTSDHNDAVQRPEILRIKPLNESGLCHIVRVAAIVRFKIGVRQGICG